MTDVCCSKCNRLLIKDGKDISSWECISTPVSIQYTCVFCLCGVPPNTVQAIELFAEGGIYPLGSKTIQEIINS